MGLRPSEYYRLTPVEFGLMYEGFRKKEIERKKELRLLSYFIVKGWADPKSMPRSMEEWWPIDEGEKAANSVDINSWSEDKKNSALQLIQRMTGG